MVAPAITVSDDLTFTLSNANVTYTFRANTEDGELYHVFFGGAVTGRLAKETPRTPGRPWGAVGKALRELPDLGRGDMRNPAIRIRHGKSAITRFTYVDYDIISGKPKLDGLPSTFSSEKAEEAKTLIIHLEDKIGTNDIHVYLSYSVFASSPAIARSLRIVNKGSEPIVIERAASFSVDMPNDAWDMVHLTGTSNRETQFVRQKVYDGNQGFQSNNGASSHAHAPFLALVSSNATETTGHAYGFNLVYSGSHAASAERSPPDGSTRVMLGLNPLFLSWNLSSNESFTTPECVAVYSASGLGGMSRALHRLYRTNLSRSDWTFKPRPVLINNWEGTYFDFDADKLLRIASMAAPFGVKMFVMDDGWFGDKYPRINSSAGLGDWVANPKRFPNGLADLVNKINDLKPAGSSKGMEFGIWVEPEMVNPNSELYHRHPDWIMYSGDYPRTQFRNQYVLDLSIKEVQDYLIETFIKLLSSANIAYVKWDCNRRLTEMPEPASAHGYVLGLYRIIAALTDHFPKILWEACAGGGGRFDSGILHYWPQTWASDNTDGLDRISIQFGNSMVYPPSMMTGHISMVPNHLHGRITPLLFRAHVAMMCGSFGFELDPAQFTDEERELIPSIIELGEKVNPIVLNGDLYRLSRPDESNWPAAQFVSEDKRTAVVLAFQMAARVQLYTPPFRLQGLDEKTMYDVTIQNDRRVHLGKVDGKSLMVEGLSLIWGGDASLGHPGGGDYQSKVIWVESGSG
ncbi:MAG: hypothetical protein TREMPRED_002553 [Tremellales sp. Tagirdzhanova-0007]|nr:MAG: hypothetical protein TREMPRED_002553 [Tremellales sp. Tagirdzhanova-0007]